MTSGVSILLFVASTKVRCVIFVFHTVCREWTVVYSYILLFLLYLKPVTFFLLSQSCDIRHLAAFAWCHIYSVYCYQIVSCAGSTIKRKISMMQARLFRYQLLSYALLLFLGVFQNVLNTKVLVAWTERSFVFSAVLESCWILALVILFLRAC